MKAIRVTRGRVQRITVRTNATLARLIADDEGMSTAEYSMVRKTSPR